MSEKIDIKAVAKRAGVSVGTVSMSLNNNPVVKASTRTKIQALALEMGYVPNIIAQVVSNHHNRAVGVVLPNSMPEFFGRTLHGLMVHFEMANQHAFTVYGQDSPDNEIYYLKMFSQLKVRGVVMSPCPGTTAKPLIERLIANGTRVTFMDRVITGVDADFVGIDYAEAARVATERLIAAGHKRFAAIIGSPMFSVTSERMSGMRKALSKAGIAFDQKMTLRMDYLNFHNQELVLSTNRERLLGFLKEHRPTVMFLAMDGNFSLLLKICEELGWRVPEDLNIVAFEQPIPRVSHSHDFMHVICPIEEVGAMAGKAMIERLENPEAPHIRRRLRADVWPETTCGPAKS